MSDLLIGVDGGQTSTQCVLATTQGRILGRGEGGPLIHLAAERGAERISQSLAQAVRSAWVAAGLEPQPVESIGLGLSGVEAGTLETAKIVDLLLPSIVQAQYVDVVSDAFTALLGAHLGKPGIVAISGTGSIVLGMDEKGKQARAGGWGWLLGDEGSAFAIGRAGLLAAFYALDGVQPPTRLEELLMKHMKVSAIHDMKRIVYAPEFGARGFAALAPLVSHAADQGDAAAAEIVRNAGFALAKQVGAVIRRLHFDQDVRVAPIGGAFEHVSGMLAAFCSAMRDLPEPTTVVRPEMPPVLGAVILAMKHCGVGYEQAIPRLRQMSGNR